MSRTTLCTDMEGKHHKYVSAEYMGMGGKVQSPVGIDFFVVLPECAALLFRVHPLVVVSNCLFETDCWRA